MWTEKGNREAIPVGRMISSNCRQGHEKYRRRAKFDFSDRQVAREYLAETKMKDFQSGTG
jgi:hypothetical protein